MPRSEPSITDVQLLAAAAQRGARVSYTQLERWRAMELVPRNIRRGAGRGRGSTSVAPDGALDRLVAAASSARQGSKLLMGDPLMRAVTHRAFRPGSVKAAVTAVFDNACAELGADLDEHLGPDAAGDARFTAAARATARGGWRMQRGLADWVATGIEPPAVRAPRTAMRDVLQSVASGGRDISLDALTAAAVATGQTKDIGDPDINAIWARLEARGTMASWLADELLADELVDGPDQDDSEFDDGLEQALANWSLPAMRDRIRASPEGDLVAAAKAVVIVASFQGMITLLGLPRAAGHSEIVPPELGHFASVTAAQAMVDDPMFKLLTHNWPAANGSRKWLEWLAFQAGLTAILGMTAELGAYAERLMKTLYPCGPTAVVANLLALKNNAAIASAS